MITFSFEKTDQKVVATIRAKGPTIIEALRVRMDAVTFALRGKIVTEKLSGQVLHKRSGRLARSVRQIPATLNGAIVTGRVEAGIVDPRSNAVYAVFHEYGVNHPWAIEPKTAKALAFEIAGNLVFAKRVTHPGLQERSFMRSTLAESSNAIAASFREALMTALVAT
jgi:hypothetical protein